MNLLYKKTSNAKITKSPEIEKLRYIIRYIIPMSIFNHFLELKPNKNYLKTSV